MPFTSGTSTDHNDLLLDLKTWLVGTVGWTQLAWTPAPGGVTTQARLHVRGPGAGAGRETFINIQTRNNAGAGAYGWAVTGSTNYDSGASWGAQPTESPEVFLNTWQNSIDWWAYANDRHFKLVAKVSASYLHLYAGFYLPIAIPNEYNMPLFIGGNYFQLAPYSSPNTRNRFYIDPGDGCAYYLRRNAGSWTKVANQYDGTGNTNIQGSSTAVIWPHRVPRGVQGTTDWNAQAFTILRPNAAGELPIYNCHIVDAGNHELAGALDGVYAAAGFGKSSEQTFSISGTNYKLFQNIGRATERDFLAVEVV